MRNLTATVITVITMLLLASVTPQAEASCGSNPLIITRTGPGPEASFIFSQGQWGSWPPVYLLGYPPFWYTPPFTSHVQATFWALGTGNPALGVGDDSGSWNSPPYSWLYYYSYYGYYYGAEIFAGWGMSSSIDGCLQDNPPGTCTCVLITDEDGQNGYFAMASNHATLNTWFTELAQPGNDPAGNYASIILRPVPRPVITGSARDPQTYSVYLTITVPPPEGPLGGIYQSGGDCDCGPTGFQIVHQILPRGSPAPSSRQIDEGWVPMTLTGGLPQGFTPMGESVTVGTICEGAFNSDTYIAALLQFDSGFTSPVVSANATRIECGPNFATPEEGSRPARDLGPLRAPQRKR